MQTLGALRHFDYNVAGAYAYEQAVETIRLLGLGMGEVEQLLRRAVFNVVARNQDDHVKNIAFLMDRAGRWRLSPAYDVAYAYNADGPWTHEHQMSLAGKRSGFRARRPASLRGRIRDQAVDRPPDRQRGSRRGGRLAALGCGCRCAGRKRATTYMVALRF